MQYCKVTIDIGGDQLNSIGKKVAVCDIPILERIHGADSVKVFEVLGERKVDHRKELDRLKSHYTGRNERGELFVDVLYGTMIGGKLPETLAEINKTLFNSDASGTNFEDEPLDALDDPLDFRSDDAIKAAQTQAAEPEDEEELELVPPSGKKGK